MYKETFLFIYLIETVKLRAFNEIAVTKMIYFIKFQKIFHKTNLFSQVERLYDKLCHLVDAKLPQNGTNIFFCQWKITLHDGHQALTNSISNCKTLMFSGQISVQ